MRKKRLFGIVGAIIICAALLVYFVSDDGTTNAANTDEVAERIENALGEEYQKQSMTELMSTIQYGDEEGNAINYYILKSTYYDADPAEVTGLNTDAISLMVTPEAAVSCREMKIHDWAAALYETDTLSYLCWTYSPEISCILEYDPQAVAEEEIIKMAESIEAAE